MRKIYLAIPYSGLEERSFSIANLVAGMLMERGDVVYSPISHSHSIAKVSNLPKTWEFWGRIDMEFLKWADEIVVIVIGDNKDGMELIKGSKGVQAEIEMANELGKEVKYFNF